MKTHLSGVDLGLDTNLFGNLYAVWLQHQPSDGQDDLRDGQLWNHDDDVKIPKINIQSYGDGYCQ